MKTPSLVRLLCATIFLVTVAAARAQLTGNVDAVDANGNIWGWAGDLSNPDKSIAVQFYVDSVDSSHFAGSVEPAEEYDRSDVWLAYSWANWPAVNHGYVFSIPNSSPNDPSVTFNLRNGATHHIYVYAIGLNGGSTLIGDRETPAFANLDVSLTQPISTNGKFWLAPNQLAANRWYHPAPLETVINDHIEGSFDHFDYWPTLNSTIRKDWDGFGIAAPEIGHMNAATLLKFRAAGIPLTADPPAFTQPYDGNDLARMEFDGVAPPSNPDMWCNTFNFCGTISDRQDPRVAGWFRTRDGSPYTPDEIILDERMPNLVPSFNFGVMIGDFLPGESWQQKKDRARVNRDPYPSISSGPDRIPILINDYVNYAKAMKLHFVPGPAPRLSVHWNVNPGWEWSDEAWWDQIHNDNSDPAAFETAARYVHNPLHNDTKHLEQLIKTMCSNGTCPDTVYMDMELVYISETHYALDVLRRNKAVVEANNVKFGIDLADQSPLTCTDEQGNVTTLCCKDAQGNWAHCVVNMTSDGNALYTTGRDPSYTQNMLFEESILNITNYLLVNGIIDRNTKVRLESWTDRPQEQGSGINENYTTLAHAANRVINEYLTPQGFDRSWSQQGLAATYFDNGDFTGATVMRRDPSVNFDWGLGSPDPQIAPSDFSARWEGQIWAGYNETYTFYTLSDDGVRLWVNNQLLIANWSYHGPTENSATINLVRGQKYNIKLEYFQGGGGATMKLSWSSPSQAKEVIPESRLFSGTGLHASYFNNLDFSGTPLTRIDPTVNFDWGYGSPDPRIGPDIFCARWEGKVVPRFTGDYTFYTQADDGAVLWVNGQLLVNDWNPHPVTENAGPPIHLEAGQKYDIRFDYGEGTQTAVAVLLWSSPDQPKEVIPQSQLYPE